jgi:ABC-type transport system involved in multi-copper enzyme maturation permease subunit
MKVFYLAQTTLSGLIRNKILIVFILLFVGIILLMLTPLLTMKALKGANEVKEARSLLSSMLVGVFFLANDFGAMLAIFASASAVSDEIKMGTILPIMAKPITRWQFLLGKYVGTQLLLLIYTLTLLGFAYALTWLLGEKIYSSPLIIGGYLFVKYMLYSALALFLSIFMNAYVAAGLIVLFIITADSALRLLSLIPYHAIAQLKNFLYYLLPSTNLFDVSRFIVVTYESIETVPRTHHLTVLAYGLDYTTIIILLAIAVFHKRHIVAS